MTDYTTRQALYAELMTAARKFVEAGGDLIMWAQPGDESETHEMVMAGTIVHATQMLADIEGQLGESAFSLALMAAKALGPAVPAKKSSATEEWDSPDQPWMKGTAPAEEDKEENVS